MLARSRLLRLPVNEHDHVRGPADAPFTLVEYGDYQSPATRRNLGVANELLASLPNLRYVFRHFPETDRHPRAFAAATAAEAAALQGKFWEMHSALAHHHRALTEENLLTAARTVGLDEARFLADRGSLRVEQRIWAQHDGGVKSGVLRAPCFFVNGHRHEGKAGLAELLGSLREVVGEAGKKAA